MAQDFEDFYDIESLSDDELLTLIREELDGYSDLDAGELDIVVRDGSVTVSGRVGTEAELQQLEHLLTDVLRVPARNDVVVDELRRHEQPDAADEANARIYTGGSSAHGGADRTEDSAEHLLQDTAAEQYGTDDVGEAIERGQTYNPPETPIQEGTWNKEGH